MKLIPNFSTLFSDLIEEIFDWIARFFGAVLAAIGELFVSACEAALGSSNLVIVIPSGLVSAVLVGSGIRLLTGGGMVALVSIATLIIVGVLFVFFVLAILLAAARRKRQQ